MAFNMTSTFTDDTGDMTLSGSLDAKSAPILTAEVQKAIDLKCKRLVLRTSELEYVASAGLRVILFAKQKLGSSADIYVIAPTETVLEVLQHSGFDQAVIIQDTYEQVK